MKKNNDQAAPKSEAIEIRYLIKNTITGKYWDGNPAPDSFQATRETAKPCDADELQSVLMVYRNVASEAVEMISDES